MDWWLLTFFLGAILSLFLPEVPAISQLFLLIFLAFGFFRHKSLRRSSGLFFGSAWLLIHAYIYQCQIPADIVDLMLAKQTFWVEGEVVSLQAKSSYTAKSKPILLPKDVQQRTARFNLKLYKINDYQLFWPVTVRLSWKKPTLVIPQGSILSLPVKLKPAHGLANLGSFNYLTWLKSHDIAATGYVVKAKLNTKNKKARAEGLLPTKHHQTLQAKITFRQRLFNQYNELMPKHQLRPILLALAFGERSLLKPQHWQTLQATGTSHLIAISGLHVGLLASGVFMLVVFIMRYLPFRNPDWQSYNVIYLAIFASLVLASIYAYLAGFSLPTQRALVMLMLFWCSRLLAIKLSMTRLVLVTVFIIIIVSPFSLLTISFWLSFYAVIIIFLSLWRFKAWLNKGSTLLRFIKGLTILQLSLTLMLLPITAIAFQQISTVSLAANIIAVPWMSIITIPTALLSVLFVWINESISQWFMFVSLQSLTWLWQYLRSLTDLPYANISLTLYEQRLGLVVGLLAFALIFLPMKISIKHHFHYLRYAKMMVFIFWSSLPFCLLMKAQHIREDTKIIETVDNAWQVIFFDVGQGLSVLIKRDDRVVLYDTGAYYASGFNMSEAVILPYLQYLGINKIDKVIISHGDNDHAGGMEVLDNHIVIDEIISNDSVIMSKPVKACVQDNTFIWQGLIFETLSPTLKTVNANKIGLKRSKNDDSCVVRISDSNGRSLLLVGDISSKVERDLLTQFPKLSADILQVPHHGSTTSSSESFLEQVSPTTAVVSAGYLNRWHMPVISIQQRYLDKNIKLLNTAQLGQIILTIDENGITTRSFVDDFKPFWFIR